MSDCASFLERVSSVMSPKKETKDPIKDYHERLLEDKEVKALFVNPDRNFIIKWGCTDHNTCHIPNDQKETIFDTTYLLFAM